MNPTPHGKAAITTPLITENNAKRPKRWCYDHKTWTSDNWKYIIWSDESSFMFFPTSGRVYVCRMPKEAYSPECQVPTVKYGGGSVTTWTAISWYSACPIITLSGQITARDYVVHPIIQCFSLTMMQFFKITICPYTQPVVFSVGYRSMKMHFIIFPGQHNLQT
jgi:hypothetical protein